MISTTKRLLINEWITSNYDSLQALTFDDPVIETVFEFLNEPDNDIELLKSITKKLYEIYQTGDDKLRLLTLCFIPTLVAIYIRVAHNYYNLPKGEFHSLAILLLAVYNCEIIQQSPESVDSGRLKTIDIRVISLMKPSIYHEPNLHTASSQNVSLPTGEVLARHNNPNESKISIFGPYEEVEQLVMANYMSVCTVLFKVYNQYISLMGTFSHNSLCQYFDRLLRQGTNFKEKVDFKKRIHEYLHDANSTTPLPHHHEHQQPFRRHHHSQSAPHHSVPQFVLPRNSVQIQFNSQMMVELTRSVYYCIYNELTEPAYEVLELIVKRSTAKLYGDVLLMVNAIKNSVAIKHDRDLSIEGTSVATRRTTGAPHTTSMSSLNSFTSITAPESKWSTVKKTAITNASFKTRKLPDDIPIVTSTAPGGVPTGTGQITTTARPTSSHHHGHALLRMQNSKNLDSIDEENAEQRLLANGDAGKSSGGGSAKKATSGGGGGSGKKTIINVLKELKEKQIMPKFPQKDKDKDRDKENGKVSNSSNHHTNLNHSKVSTDSDASGLSDGCGRLSLEDGDEMIPMKRLNKFNIDADDDFEHRHHDEMMNSFKSVADETDESHHRLLNHRGSNGESGGNGVVTMATIDDDEGGSSDRSGSSSKGLLNNNSSNSKKSPANTENAKILKLSTVHANSNSG